MKRRKQAIGMEGMERMPLAAWILSLRRLWVLLLEDALSSQSSEDLNLGLTPVHQVLPCTELLPRPLCPQFVLFTFPKMLSQQDVVIGQFTCCMRIDH